MYKLDTGLTDQYQGGPLGLLDFFAEKNSLQPVSEHTERVGPFLKTISMITEYGQLIVR